MIKRLQIKIVLIITLLLAIAVAVLMLSINIMSQGQSTMRLRENLEKLPMIIIPSTERWIIFRVMTNQEAGY